LVLWTDSAVIVQIDARQIEHQSHHRRAPTMNIAVYHFTIGVPVEDGCLTTEPGYAWETP
jgi:hypothetical protein